jgi:hypothetical protein
MLACALVETRTEARPRDQVAVGLEARHVETNLAGHHVDDVVAEARHGVQIVDVLSKVTEGRAHARLQIANSLLKFIHLAEVQTEQEAMMVGHPPPQCLDELLAGSLEAADAQVHELFGIGLAGNQRLEDLASTGAHDVADRARELDVGVLENLLNAVGVLHDLASELLTCSREVADLLDRCWRHKAAADQPVGEQVSKPHRIVHVRLAPGNVLDVLRVRKHELERILEHVPDRLPVNAARLHHDMRALVPRHPLGQRE